MFFHDILYPMRCGSTLLVSTTAKRKALSAAAGFEEVRNYGIYNAYLQFIFAQ